MDLDELADRLGGRRPLDGGRRGLAPHPRGLVRRRVPAPAEDVRHPLHDTGLAAAATPRVVLVAPEAEPVDPLGEFSAGPLDDSLAGHPHSHGTGQRSRTRAKRREAARAGPRTTNVHKTLTPCRSSETSPRPSVPPSSAPPRPRLALPRSIILLLRPGPAAATPFRPPLTPSKFNSLFPVVFYLSLSS